VKPSTDRGVAMIVGLLLMAVGLAIGLPPLALWGPGAALAVPGTLLFLLAVVTPPEADK
jgi:hypothetical protein